MALLNFNAAEVEPSQGFQAVPTDWYTCTIEQSEMRATNDEKGAYLWLMFGIVDGEYAGQKLFTNLNIENANPKTVKIAYGQLSAIAHAVGVLNVENSELLHDIPLKVRAKYQPANPPYDEQNQLTAFKNVNEVTHSAGAVAAKPAKAAPATKAPPAAKASAKEAWKPKTPPPPAEETGEETAGDPDTSFPFGENAPEYIMLEAANGISREEYLENGWTDEDLIENAYMELFVPLADPEPVAKKAPPPPPKKTIAKPPVKSAAAAPAAGSQPWKKKPAA